MASFWKPEACGQTVLPDKSVSIGQKLVENAKMPKIQMRHFRWFSNTVIYQLSSSRNDQLSRGLTSLALGKKLFFSWLKIRRCLTLPAGLLRRFLVKFCYIWMAPFEKMTESYDSCLGLKNRYFVYLGKLSNIQKLG